MSSPSTSPLSPPPTATTTITTTHSLTHFTFLLTPFSTNRFVEKGLLAFQFVQELMWDLTMHCQGKDFEELLPNLIDNAMVLLATRPVRVKPADSPSNARGMPKPETAQQVHLFSFVFPFSLSLIHI